MRYTVIMTLVEVTYDLPGPLHPEQLRALGQFANTYGLRRVRVNEHTNQIVVEYDGSRLTETQVARILGKVPIQAIRHA